jgi:6,7-dimethyl-8-ribityllumazine synthase
MHGLQSLFADAPLATDISVRGMHMARPRRAAKKETAPDSLDGVRVLVVEARFYDDIANALLEGATSALKAAGVTWDVISVPGSLEIVPAIAIAVDAAKAQRQPYDGVVALGCVIRGETSHYEIVAGESARALTEIAVALRLPVGNGILTVDTDAQAWTRARPYEENKGGGAAEAALALVRLKRRLATRRRR